jgi:alkanesulfonate monooxygenase SsuD/methylene tetrahydromethanopterin reductase-like flavin-dependent oxidoreductase (luciferase family)
MTQRILVAEGTPQAIADKLEMLHHETGANGGFILGRGFHAMDNIREFVDLVVPELQRRGLSKKSYGGSTLRENLHD